MAIAGAFAYAELGRLLPRAGGQYVYLREAWHPVVGFLYGWALLFLIETGAIAAVAIAFAQYALRLAGSAGDSRRSRSRSQRSCMLSVDQLPRRQTRQPRAERLRRAQSRRARRADSVRVVSAGDARLAARRRASTTRRPTALTFGAALIPILFAYGGWQVANYVAEEMRDPERHLPRSLILGTLTVVAIYLLVNVAYLRTLGLDGLAGTTTPAAETAGRWFGASRRAVRRGGDRDLDVRLPQSRRARALARVLRDGGRRRVLPGARASCIRAYRHARRRDHPAVGVGDRAGADAASTATCSTRSCSPTGSSSASRSRACSSCGRGLAPTPGYRTPGYPVAARASSSLVAVVVVYSTIQRGAGCDRRSAPGCCSPGIPVFYLVQVLSCATPREARLDPSLTPMLADARSRRICSGPRRASRADRSRRQQPAALRAGRSARRARGARPDARRTTTATRRSIEAIARALRRRASARRARPAAARARTSSPIAALVGAGDDVLIERPTYDPLIGACATDGREHRALRAARSTTASGSTRTTCARALTPRTRLIVVTTPHNPSGVAVDRATLGGARAASPASCGAHRARRRGVSRRGVPRRRRSRRDRPVRRARRRPGRRDVEPDEVVRAGRTAVRLGDRAAGDRRAPAPHARRRGQRRAARRPTGWRRSPGRCSPQLADARARVARRQRRARARSSLLAHPEFELARAAVVLGRVSAHCPAQPISSCFVQHVLERHGVAVAPGRFFEAPGALPHQPRRPHRRAGRGLGDWRGTHGAGRLASTARTGHFVCE